MKRVSSKLANRISLLLFFGLLTSSMVSNIPYSSEQIAFGASNSTQTSFVDGISNSISNVFSPTPPPNPDEVKTQGTNFNNVFNPKTHQGTFTTHPDYLLDYIDYKQNPVYVPYKIIDNGSYITYSSAHNSVVFYSDSCTIKIYPGGKILSTSKPIVDSVSFDLQTAVNGSDVWSSSSVNGEACHISYNQSQDSVTFDMIQGSVIQKDIKFIFNLNGIPETVLSVTNNDGSITNTKFGFAMSLNNVASVNTPSVTFTDKNTTGTIQLNEQQFNGTLLQIKDNTSILQFDTQDNVNHYLWATKVTDNPNGVGLILDYKNSKGPLLPGSTLEIDPTWTSGIGSSQGIQSTTGTTLCTTANAKSVSDFRVVTPPTGNTANYCELDTERWNISGFSAQWTPTAISFQTNIVFSSGRDKTCQISRELNDPNTATAAQLQLDIMTGPTYATAQNFCEQPPGGPFTSVLGGTAVSDFSSQEALGWYAVGLRFDDQVKDHAHTDEADFSNTTLVVTYSWIPPAPITDLSCNDNAINSVACTWSVPASPDSIVGYYLTKNVTLNAPLYDKRLVGYYRLDYDDPTAHILDSSSTKNNGTFGSGSFTQVTGKVGFANNFTNAPWINLNNPSQISFDSTNSFSIFSWLRQTSTGTYQTILSKDNNPTAYTGIIYQVQGSNQITVQLINNIGTGNWIDVLSTSTTLLTDKNWHYVGFTYDGSKQGSGVKLYVDGVSVPTTIAVNGLTGTIISATNWSLGKENDCGCNFWNGEIDDLRFFNYVVPPSQVTKLYNYQIISTNSYTDTTSIYPFTYNYNVVGLSDKGQIANILGNTVQIAPYNVIDPPFKLQTTLSRDSGGWFENLQWVAPKVANSICGQLCTPNGYQVQHLNTTTHLYQTDSANQTALSFKTYKINQNVTQNFRIFTNNHAGLSVRGSPLNQTTFPQEVSHWYLQNNLIDTRNLNNGTLTGNWNFTNGRVGNAQFFDTNTYDNFGSSTSLQFDYNTPFTLTGWIYLSSLPNGNIMFSKMNGGLHHQGYYLWFDASGNTIFDLTPSTNSPEGEIVSGTGLTTNTWYYITATYDGSGNQNGMKLYKNGVLITQGSSSSFSSSFAVSNPFLIGIDGGLSTSRELNGFVSDPRVFSSSLNQQQITDLYNEATRSKAAFAGTSSLVTNIAGNYALNNDTVSISSGFPQVSNATKYYIFNGTQLLNLTNSNVKLIGTTYQLPIINNLVSIFTNSNFKAVNTIQTLDGNINLTSNIVTTKGNYNPGFVVSPTSGNTYNVTVTRNSPFTTIQVEYNQLPVLFNGSITGQTGAQVQSGAKAVFHNFTNQGGIYLPLSVASTDTIYLTGYNPSTNKIIWTQTSYGSGSQLLPGINILNATYLGFIGVPVGVFGLVMLASLANQRTGPIWVVIVLAIAGMLTLFGFFTISPNIWALCLITGMLGLLVGRKVF